MNCFDLNEKIAVVTGGYGHLGHAMSLGLADFGADVYVLGRSKEKFLSRFSEKPPKIFFKQCDIAKTEDIKSSFKAIFEEKGSLDILICNAAYARGRQPMSISDEDWGYSIDGVLNSVYRCMREIMPYFVNQQSGKIINISSMYGVVSPDFRIYDKSPDFLNPPHYGAAKAGVIHLTRYFAQFLGQHNVQVNAISPGPFPKESIQKNESFLNELIEKNPLKKIGKPEDIIGATILLSSAGSNYITGHNLIVDGGWTIT